MRERKRWSLCVATLGAALLLGAPARALEPGPEPPGVMHAVAVGVDLVIVRPMGLGAVAVGAVLFVPVALISAPQGRDGLAEAFELFVTLPVDFVFRRPLGDF